MIKISHIESITVKEKSALICRTMFWFAKITASSFISSVLRGRKTNFSQCHFRQRNQKSDSLPLAAKSLTKLNMTRRQPKKNEKPDLIDKSGFWRSGWDSNPRYPKVQLISSQSRYDHFDTSPNVRRDVLITD